MVTVEPVKLTQLVQLGVVAIFRLWPCPQLLDLGKISKVAPH